MFTTNLIGQAVFENRLRLDDQLSQFSAELGKFRYPLTGQVTLEYLGDFTAGFPSLAPLCKPGEPPETTGCLPSRRPPISGYGALDFLAFFQNYKEKMSSLPAPYEYSDYSTGLLGLLLGTASGHPMANGSVDGRYDEVNRRILRPLDMQSPFLYLPATAAGRRAKGYNLAIASAVVTGGAISQINLLGHGRGYTAAPQVTIIGGGGTGAAANAVVKDGRVTAISIAPGGDGSGYVAPPSVIFGDVGQKKGANAIAIIGQGRVKAVLVVFGGSGYSQAPAVTISGGGGAGATATAHIANGRVVAVTVGHPGSGYADRLAVIVAPGKPLSSVVPVWAPAGALKSTMDDLMRFAEAALPHRAILPWLPPSLTAGFQIAERAYACHGKNPDLAACPATSNRSGLAWGITPADEAEGMPEVVVKDGGLPAFSSEILLVPQRQLAVVVLVNSRSPAEDPIGRFTFRPAETLATNIGYNLLCALPGRGLQ